ncbi:MAG: RNA methyltransferase [Paludibacter sp.]|nr:RNA methyltransferase [Paludibacter sp.]MDD4198807.1 RNA methyltransferase [Paludibacter sp.]MDD4428765.1 RNA methyltransferase [Paludibacter sp.]
MLSKSKIKLISSLAYKKYRDETGLFVAEGAKLIRDLSTAFHCEWLLYTPEWENEIRHLQADEKIAVEEKELHKISTQKSPQGMLAVFRKKTPVKITATALSGQLCLALDDIQDPGNLGTIIRIADWFGIKHIFCSTATADAFSPKTVQATMGALARIDLHYVNLSEFLLEMKNIPVYGTFLDGTDLYTKDLTPNGIIVMGNEGNGISPEVALYVTDRLMIPNFPKDAPTSESLNVAVATAIVCGEFRRRG